MKNIILPLLILTFSFQLLLAQNYTPAGSAVGTSDNCFELTNTTDQSGAVWNVNTINLNDPLDITLNINFGNQDGNGADGMSFVLQPNGTGVSAPGGGVGYEGITPSLGVVMDTYTNGNTNDPFNDHISMHKNGDVVHGNANELVGTPSTAIFPSNIEDGNDHSFRFVWDPAGPSIEVYFDGDLTLSYTGDIINDIFSGNPVVFWGVSASTGGLWNLQTMCLEITADFEEIDSGCTYVPIQFTDNSFSGTTINSWDWNFGDGTVSIDQNPIHTYNAPGTYTVELLITNIAGLTSTTTYEIEISGPTVTAIANQNPLCLGSPLSLGGGGAEAYVWDNGVANTVAFTPNLGTHTYTVIGTDVNGCKDTTDITVVVNPNPSPEITGIFDLCNTNSTTIDAGNFAGYLWSTTETTQTIDVAIAGNYSVTVTNEFGCTGDHNININANVMAGFSESEDQCLEGNSFNFNNTGDSNSDLTWSWEFEGGTPSISNFENPNGITWSTPGIYTVTQHVFLGECTDTKVKQIEVFEHPSPTLSATQVSCFGICDGTATVDQEYASYEWSNGATHQSLTNLCGGDYCVTVTNINGCTHTACINIYEPPKLLVYAQNSTDVTCNGDQNGSLTISTIGGTGPILYDIGESNNNGSFPDLNGGVYTVSITDANGCYLTSSPIVINEPPAITVTNQSFSDASCYNLNNGSIQISAQGGLGNLSYSIDENSQISGEFNHLLAGDYTTTITDANACTIENHFTIEQPSEISIANTPEQTVCLDQSINVTVSVTGGILPYTYYWEHDNINENTINTIATTDTIFSVYVTDANHCTSNTSKNFINIIPPVDLSIMTNTTELCKGEPVEITILPFSGTGAPYSITVNNVLKESPYIDVPNQTKTYEISVIDACASSKTETISIQVNPLPESSFVTDIQSGCLPLTVNFTAQEQVNIQSYQWDFGDGQASNVALDFEPTHIYTDPGVFHVALTAITDKGCSFTNFDAYYIAAHPTPTANFFAEEETVSELSPIITFINYSKNNERNLWDFGDGHTSTDINPTHSFPNFKQESYEVKLVAISHDNCKDSTNVRIKVRSEHTFYAPTAFSPDGSGHNESFIVKGNQINPNDFKMLIYDRWGELIFETDKLNTGWTGEGKTSNISPIGVYSWLVIYKDLQQNEHQESGTVTLIR